MDKNSTMEKPTRKAKALAIPPEGCFPDDFPLPFIMKNKAEAKLPKMAKNAIATRYVMCRIIG